MKEKKNHRKQIFTEIFPDFTEIYTEKRKNGTEIFTTENVSTDILAPEFLALNVL